MSDASNSDERLARRVSEQRERLEKAERERPTLMAQTVYLGVLGLLLVVPVVAGAYLGTWLDERLTGYSFSWTVSLICLGVFVGAVNVWLFIRD